MASIRLICPRCRHQDEHDNVNMDVSKPISCSFCGYSELPTGFELGKEPESKLRQIIKIGIILVGLVAFAFLGLSLIAIAAFFTPYMAAVVFVFYLLERRKNKNKAKK